MWIKSVGWFCVLVLSGLVALIPQRAAAQDTSTTEELKQVSDAHDIHVPLCPSLPERV
jgi:hypothetical protein